MRATQYRFARPTLRLKELVQFYTEVLGLKKIGEFIGHDGYDGVMIGLPGSEHHLEFTQHESGGPLPAPTAEHLLVFYFDDPAEYRLANDRLEQHGYSPIKPENPYWEGKSKSYQDPDGWGIVLFDGLFS